MVLGSDTPCSKEKGNPAETAAQAILESRVARQGFVVTHSCFWPRTKQGCKISMRRLGGAWHGNRYSGNGNSSTFRLTRSRRLKPKRKPRPALLRLAFRRRTSGSWSRSKARPDASMEWQATRLSGQHSLRSQGEQEVESDELLVTGFAATRLRMELDRVPLWRGDHVSIKQIVDDFARYLYLPRVSGPTVLLNAISDGIALLTWEQDAYAFADCFDDEAKRYRGLRGGQVVSLPDADAPGLLVKSDIARQQLDAERAQPPSGGEVAGAGAGGESPVPGGGSGSGEVPAGTPPAPQPKRFHGTATLDAERVGRDASRIADEVIAHLSSLAGAKVTVTLEIEAEVPAGAPDHVVRTVTENSRH